MGRLTHNKKRNIGLVYEFLTREVASAVVASDCARAARVCEVIATHLSEGKTLHHELSLHREAMAMRGVSERLARRIVDELKAAGLRSSVRRNINERAKSDLIHEINRSFGQGIFDRYRIPDYTAHASIGIILNRGLSGQLAEGIELARVEDHLIGFMMSEGAGPAPYNPDATLYAYKTAVGLFEQEFGRQLTAEQSELLGEFVRFSLGGNPAPLQRTVERQRGALRESLRLRRVDEVFQSDPVMLGRLDEALNELDALPNIPDDTCIEKLMLFHNLNREIES